MGDETVSPLVTASEAGGSLRTGGGAVPWGCVAGGAAVAATTAPWGEPRATRIRVSPRSTSISVNPVFVQKARKLTNKIFVDDRLLVAHFLSFSFAELGSLGSNQQRQSL